MEMQSAQQPAPYVILEDDAKYYYTVQRVQVSNPLGAVVGSLQEYRITGMNGENYILHKTHEGNWYDSPGNDSSNNAILRALKTALDNT